MSFTNNGLVYFYDFDNGEVYNGLYYIYNRSKIL